MAAPDSESLLRTLVAFDTTSHASNLPLMHFVQGFLATYGVESRLVPDVSGHKANLLATVGPSARPGFLLAGHTDVVPADGQAWHSHPFTLERRGGRLFGRGCADMKGFIASVLAAVPAMVAQPLCAPVHLAFTCDEEVGCVGVRSLLGVLDALPVKPSMGVVGEPTSMRVVVGHKGKQAFRVRVRGCEAHSSSPATGVNAVACAAAVVSFIAGLNERKRLEGPFDPLYDVPYTTLHVGAIRGGTALNIVPAECTLEFEVRHLPRESPLTLLDVVRGFVASEIEPGMRAVHPGAGIDFEEIVSYPGLHTDPDAPVVSFVQSLLDEQQPPHGVAFGAEAGLFHERCGVPMVLCGPGTMADAHRPDESVSAEQLVACDTFMQRLTASLSS